MRVDGSGGAATVATEVASALRLVARTLDEATGPLRQAQTHTWHTTAAARAEERRQKLIATTTQLGEAALQVARMLDTFAEKYARAQARLSLAWAEAAAAVLTPQVAADGADLPELMAASQHREIAEQALRTAQADLEEVVQGTVAALAGVGFNLLRPQLSVVEQLLDIPRYAARSVAQTLTRLTVLTADTLAISTELMLVPVTLHVPQLRADLQRRVQKRVSVAVYLATHPGEVVASALALEELRSRGLGAWAGTLAPDVALLLLSAGAGSALKVASTGAKVSRIAALDAQAAAASTAAGRAARVATAQGRALDAAARRVQTEVFAPTSGSLFARVPSRARPPLAAVVDLGAGMGVRVLDKGAVRATVLADTSALASATNPAARHAALAQLSRSVEQARPRSWVPRSRCATVYVAAAGGTPSCSPNQQAMAGETGGLLFGPAPERSPIQMSAPLDPLR